MTDKICIRTSFNTMTTFERLITSGRVLMVEYLWTALSSTDGRWMLWMNPVPRAKDKFQFTSTTYKFDNREVLSRHLADIFGSEVEW